MKNKIKIVLGMIIICGSCAFVSCKDMLEIDSNIYLNTDNHRLDSANDSLYSVVGILKQLQQLGDRYIVLGELRGDLMEVTKNADMHLQAVANFTATTDNPYVSTKEYYAIINNCNYYLQHIDTTIISAGKKAMKGEYAVVKTIRAWTYMQLVLNFGKAVYLTEPILTIDDMNKNYPVMEPQDLIFKLLPDVLECMDLAVYPNYGGALSRIYFIPAPVLAGDMLLWMGSYTKNPMFYELAANIYYRFIVASKYTGAGFYRNTYRNNEFNALGNGSWCDVFMISSGEAISSIAYDTNPSVTLVWPKIMRLTYEKSTETAFEYMLKPSKAAIDLWKNETYVHYTEEKELFYTKGDLRGECKSSASSSIPLGSYYYHVTDGDSLPVIAKFGYSIKNSISHYRPYVHLFRAGKLFLRYAEALNGLEKPSLAFAVLKHGLNREVLGDTVGRNRIINPDEIRPEIPVYCDFTDQMYSVDNQQHPHGIHTRGSGYVNRDTAYYAFKKETLDNQDYYGFPASLATKQDSILFVDAMICKELGLETAFEGNRFHDLMRFSIRRDDQEFLAKWVGRRDPALVGKLMNRDKWYLPSPN